MLHHRITHLRLSEAGDWDRVRVGLEALGVDAAAQGVDDLRLVRIDDHAGVLIAIGSDALALDGLADSVTAIAGAHDGRAPPLPTIGGEAVYVLHGTKHEAWSRHDALDDAQRLAHFVACVVETRMLWSLRGESWARASKVNEGNAIPVWPQPELAARCIAGAWSALVPRPIELEPFLDQWLTGMHEDGFVAVVSPSPSCIGAVVEAQRLSAALACE